MKQTDRVASITQLPLADSQRSRGTAGGTQPLAQVYPLPRSREDILTVAAHFLYRFATAQGKSTPALSEDAARFLRSRAWRIEDLALRVARAVTLNEGSLITAADLSDF